MDGANIRVTHILNTLGILRFHHNNRAFVIIRRDCGSVRRAIVFRNGRADIWHAHVDVDGIRLYNHPQLSPPRFLCDFITAGTNGRFK